MKIRQLISYTIYFLLLITFYSCKEKSPTEPEDQGETVGEVTIGTNGRSLETEDVILTVPPFAFNSQADLKLVVLSEQPPNSSSPLYRIEGIPEDYNQELEIQISSSGGSGEKYIAIGEEGFTRFHGTSEVSYNFLDATSVDGKLSAAIPVPSSGATSLKSLNQITAEVSYYFYAVDGGTRLDPAGYHFVIKSSDPNISSGATLNLLNSLEDAYETFQDRGFEYNQRTNWPVNVIVKDLGENVFGYYADSFWGINHGYLEFNSKKIGNFSDARVTAAHEFFHFVQSFYDPRTAYQKYKGYNYPHYWVDEATGIWAERAFSPNPQTYASTITSQYQMRPFEGMHKGISIGAKEHGYGMSSMFVYLADELYTSNYIWNLYSKMKTGIHPVEAIIETAGEPINWYEQYLRNMILGEFPVYGVSVPFWRQNMHDTWTISSAVDSVKRFSFAYPDLSARLYKIDINYSSLPEDASLKFSLTGDGLGEVSILRYRHTEIEFVGNGVDGWTVPSIKSNYVDQGWNLFALVVNNRAVNPYTDTKNMELEIKVDTKQEISYARGKLNQFYGTLSVTNDNGTSEFPNMQLTVEKESNVEGTMSGHVFEADWGYTFDGVYYSGTMTLSFNESQTSINNFSISGTEDDGNEYLEFTIEGSDVPVTFQTELGLEFMLEGTVLSNHIDYISYYREYDSISNGRTYESLVEGTEYFVDFSDLVITCLY